MNPAVAIIIAVCVLFSISWLLRQPRAVRLQTLTSVLVVGGVFAVLLTLFSGRLHPGLAAAGAALFMLHRVLRARSAFSGARAGAGRGAGDGGRSNVVTRILDMSLDHESGEMDGTVREGRFAGRRLSQLSLDELLELLTQCRNDDEQSAVLLQTWLDRTHGDAWRERVNAGAGHAHGNEQSSAQSGVAMSVDEARDILGVAASASHDEIVAAHRKLMQKLHPDRGGSTWLASKINQAKDLLLKSH